MKIGAMIVALTLIATMAASPKPIAIVTPSYTLTCNSSVSGKRVILTCLPSRTTPRERTVFGSWRYGDALPRAMFVDTPTGNGGAPIQLTAADNSITIGGTLGQPTIGLSTTQPNANTWSATQTYSASNSVVLTGAGAACPGAGTPIGSNTTTASAYAPFCIGPVSPVNSIVIGKVSGTQWGGTTASNSGAIDFIWNNGTVDKACYIYADSGGQVNFNGTTGCNTKFNGTVDLSVNPLTRVTYITQGAANNFGGTCTTSSSTSCTVTLGHTFTTALCTASENATTLHGYVGWSVTGATLTLTISAAAGTYTLSGVCTGNPS